MPLIAVLHSPYCALHDRGTQLQYHADVVDVPNNTALHHEDVLALIAAGASAPLRTPYGALITLTEAAWVARQSRVGMPVLRPRECIELPGRQRQQQR